MAPEKWPICRSMVGRINVEDHQTLLHTKSVSSGPHGFREEDFFKLRDNDLWGTAGLDLRGMVGRIYVGDHQPSLHT